MALSNKYWERTATVLPPSFVSSWYCNNHQKVHCNSPKIKKEKNASGSFKGSAYATMKISRDFKKRLIKNIRKQNILLDYERI